MGTYPPRECGIATFNQDLLKSSQQFLGRGIDCLVAAMNLSSLDTYIYPSEVEWKLDQENKKEHIDLAKKFNTDDFITGVMIQHEYGIYGGVDGDNILLFMEALQKPVVVTLHTVLPTPTEHMYRITERIIRRANSIVVLTQSSKKILENLYPISANKVQVIPHGVHNTHFEDTTRTKDILKLKDRVILSTFGLLSRGKGIEYVIRALPALIEKHPATLYLVLGETHPVVRRHEGESYRKELATLVTSLKLQNHVKFFDQYLTLTDLIEFLKATDVYISSSINPNQAVSGTLSYALGTGRAVISTEFAQAKEIITNNVGRLVPIMDPKSLGIALIDLLSNKQKLKKMHQNAYKMTRPMLWSNVAHEYSNLLTQNILPPLNLTHLNNMTDDFGLFQFAKFDEPNRKFGYTLDDNARALIVANWLKLKTSKVYLEFIKACQKPDGSFINYINHEHKVATNQNNKEDLEDATARAMLALSLVINIKEAKEMFTSALPHAKKLRHIRAASIIIKAFSGVLHIYPELIENIKDNADYLIDQYKENSHKSWRWFENQLGYNNAVIPEALIIAGKITKNQKYTDVGNASLEFLIKKTFTGNRYIPIGHSHWYKNEEKRSIFDQQPEDPASMILALVTAWEFHHDERYRNLIAICFSWFLGNNSLEEPLYNYENGGCFDGLHPDRINQNQGAESLVSYLLSRISIEKLYLYENSSD